MEQARYSRKGKHLTREERVVIERMSREGYPSRDIAAVLGRHVRTIQRELRRGEVIHLDSELRQIKVYNSDRGQDVHDLNATAKGPDLKLGNNYELVQFVYERMVNHKESPDVVAFRMKQAGMTGAVCTKTLYNYIEQGLISGVSNETLWEKRKRRKRSRKAVKRRCKRPKLRQSIEKRPDHIDDRQEFGHWEIDLIVGPADGSGAALLTLVERKTRMVISRQIPDKTQASVLLAIKTIERKFGARKFRQTFKTVTADNGSEFLDVAGMQTSALSSLQRTTLFYAHPYSAWERGSNENANRIIRRFIGKGTDISTVTHKRLKEVVLWINNYPRKLLDYKSPQQLFNEELKTNA